MVVKAAYVRRQADRESDRQTREEEEIEKQGSCNELHSDRSQFVGSGVGQAGNGRGQHQWNHSRIPIM